MQVGCVKKRIVGERVARRFSGQSLVGDRALLRIDDRLRRTQDKQNLRTQLRVLALLGYLLEHGSSAAVPALFSKRLPISQARSTGERIRQAQLVKERLEDAERRPVSMGFNHQL